MENKSTKPLSLPVTINSLPTEEQVLKTIFDSVFIRGMDLEEYEIYFSNDRSGLYDALTKLFTGLNNVQEKKKTIIIREDNEWEAEVFNYVIEVTEEQERIIREKCEENDEYSLSIHDCTFSDEDIKKINKIAGNSYMDFIAKYEIVEGALEEWQETGDCFRKASGLKKI